MEDAKHMRHPLAEMLHDHVLFQGALHHQVHNGLHTTIKPMDRNDFFREVWASEQAGWDVSSAQKIFFVAKKMYDESDNLMDFYRALESHAYDSWYENLPDDMVDSLHFDSEGWWESRHFDPILYLAQMTVPEDDPEEDSAEDEEDPDQEDPDHIF